MFPGFLKGSPERQQRLLRLAGGITMAVVAVIALMIAYVVPTLTPEDSNVIAVTIDTPAVGPGVEEGTSVLLHGADVGLVRGLSVNGTGTATIEVDLDKNKVRGLGQDFVMDFRPKNYFGITGINIASPGDPAHGLLRDGDRLWRNTSADYTMATMIEEGSGVATGTLTQPTIAAIKRALAYSAAFQPLIHTGIVLADTVARTQRELPAALIAKYNRIFNAIPPFASGVISGLYDIYSDTDPQSGPPEIMNYNAGALFANYRRGGEPIQQKTTTMYRAFAEKFFGLIGTLLTSNKSNLTSSVDLVTDVASVLPAIGQGAVTPVTVESLVRRLDGAFVADPDGGRTLKVNVVLDRLPVLQVPLASMQSAKGDRGR